MASWLTVEKSGGEPIDLAVFARGPRVWRYSSAESPVTVGGVTYAPAALRVGDVDAGDEPARASVRLTIARAVPMVAETLDGVPPSAPLTVTVLRHQPGATSGSPQVVLVGEVATHARDGGAVALTVALTSNATARAVPRYAVQRTCQHALYGAACGVDKSLHAFAGTVEEVSGSLVKVSGPAGAQTSGEFTAGVLSYDSGVGVEVAFIRLHSMASLVGWLYLVGPAPRGLLVGSGVTVYRGCDRTIATCNTKFANTARYGGFPFLPAKDVFRKGVR